MLPNLQNYTFYRELVETGRQTIHVKDITAQNWREHVRGILNIMKDGIETEFFRNAYIRIIFFDNSHIELYIPDYFYNIIMWSSIVSVGDYIQPCHVFFDEYIIQSSISNFINKYFIDIHRTSIDNKTLNNIIDDCMYEWTKTDDFNMYLCNTMNLDDTAIAMNEDRELYELLHADISGISLEDLNDYTSAITNRLIDKYKQSEDNCMSIYFNTQECINPKQFKEVEVVIGTKPNGNGGVFPIAISTSYINGGVNTPTSYYLDSSTGRTAQIIVKGNTGDSGAFARILGLNNTDTRLHNDPNYVCTSQNFQKVEIKNKKMLSRYHNRYFRLDPKGIEMRLDKNLCEYLVGKTIYLRSPMTCASNSAGNGICYRCYGDLAHTNNNINIGKIAAELLSSKLTQKMLSAKHLLESAIKKMRWTVNFDKYFELNYNIVQFQEEIITNKQFIIIDPESITAENELGLMTDFNEYVTEFVVSGPEGNEIISTIDKDNLYISPEFKEIIRNTQLNLDGNYCIPMESLKDIPLFLIQIHNNELSATLDKIIKIINKQEVTSSYNRHEILQALLETTIEGKLDIDSIHLELILTNQLRNINDILDTPKWEYADEDCQLLTLNSSLTNNPSITIRLMYQHIGRCLYNPLSERMNKPSHMDIFFQVRPQEYLSNKDYVSDQERYRDDKLVIPFIEKDNNVNYTIGSVEEENF